MSIFFLFVFFSVWQSMTMVRFCARLVRRVCIRGLDRHLFREIQTVPGAYYTTLTNRSDRHHLYQFFFVLSLSPHKSLPSVCLTFSFSGSFLLFLTFISDSLGLSVHFHLALSPKGAQCQMSIVKSLCSDIIIVISFNISSTTSFSQGR